MLVEATFLVLAVVVFAIWDSIKPSNFPPGPRCWPFVGSLYLFRSLVQQATQEGALRKLTARFGPVLGFRIGRGPPTVVISGPAVLQALHHAAFSGRPTSFFSQYRTMGRQRGLLYGEGLKWEEQKTFVCSRLDNAHQLPELLDHSLDFTSTEEIKRSVFRTLCRLVLGDTPEPSLLTLLEKMSALEESLTEPVHHSPWLRHVSPTWPGYTHFTSLYTQLWILISAKVYDIRKKTRTREGLTMLESLLNERGLFSESDAVACCLDLLVGGVLPTATAVSHFIEQVHSRPNVTEAVRKEVEDCLKEDEVCIRHLTRLHYCRAVLSEVQRLHTVCQYSRCHRADSEVKFDQFTVPRDAWVVMDLASAHSDPRLWEDATEFRPQRFLDSTGNYTRPPCYIPFGAGKRKCPGGDLTTNLALLILVKMFRRPSHSQSDMYLTVNKQ